MKAVYIYHFPVQLIPYLRLERSKMQVEIIEEKGNRYKVRYLSDHKNGIDKRNSEHWVSKRKVQIIPAVPEQIKLPYKD